MPEPLDTTPYTSGPKVSFPVEYNKRDLILYALGIGSRDPRFVYEKDPAFAAFPTYPVSLLKKGHSFDVLPFPSPIMAAFPTPELPGATVGLDAEKVIEKVAEFPKDGARLQMVGAVRGIHKKGSGALVETELEVVDDRGTVYYRLVDSAFMVGARDFTDSGKTFSKALPPPKEQPWQSVETPTEEHAPALYRLSGDYNPLHFDPVVAQAAGFERPIMHGQCTLGYTARALLDATAGGDQKRFKSIQTRFAAPVYPGQTLLTEIWRTSPTEFVFQTKVKETGKVCCSNGSFVLNAVASL